VNGVATAVECHDRILFLQLHGDEHLAVSNPRLAVFADGHVELEGTNLIEQGQKGVRLLRRRKPGQQLPAVGTAQIRAQLQLVLPERRRAQMLFEQMPHALVREGRSHEATDLLKRRPLRRLG
jgi:hypothetical protein